MLNAPLFMLGYDGQRFHRKHTAGSVFYNLNDDIHKTVSLHLCHYIMYR